MNRFKSESNAEEPVIMEMIYPLYAACITLKKAQVSKNKFELRIFMQQRLPIFLCVSSSAVFSYDTRCIKFQELADHIQYLCDF